ncbi:dephospho-CoA kinase [Halochromatium roseum]|uniref:dephospho-CoA kinase n=1 Tax=Halochromatium roseum TaxID=391920 RepID=UPI001911717C|nr:dephospho-CoA kinase [Halochromatium roseum]MBK5939565.1 dephospho-CoA kinase [Halochromatium roseum]
MTYRVALTGGIGSGKSTVAEEFASFGVTVSDADAISHRLTAPGGEALPAIAATFGAEMIDATGALDRARMRQQVFADPAARQRLEGILHPLIRTDMLAETEAISGPYALLVIPLLLETGQQSLVDRVLVVDLPEAMQIARVQARSGLEPDQIQRIIASQVSRAERLAAADDRIDNGGDPASLWPQVERLHQAYLKLAQLHDDRPPVHLARQSR